MASSDPRAADGLAASGALPAPQLGVWSFHTLPTGGTDGTASSVLAHLTARFPQVDETTWVSRMSRGWVRWDDGESITPSTSFVAGRRLAYVKEVEDEPEPDGDVRIVYRDDRIAVLDKPTGIPVTPSGRYVRRSLLHQARLRLDHPAPTPAHRIDRDTAGLVLFVLAPEDRARYQGLFASRRVHKVYEAWGRGTAEPPAFVTLRSQIERDDDGFRWSTGPLFGPSEVPSGGGRARMRGLSVTDVYRAEGLSDGVWRFRVVPETGRPHQIRLHLAALGFPIVGDPLYPSRRSVPASDGPLRLLAKELRFRDPDSGSWRVFESSRRLPPLV
ncbi:MAG: pseudouridine synthase [Candidatus Eisenbacteria bacterium]|uniref:Pseudouridine synthase n=1 Tax=Eiseniibacteriota bacterium TaxID=2212470 RepID=A0A956NFY6_UNCEI|nr:pseudouridine synthase [Candidatus Eisenbacteria bacterium]